MNYVNCKLVTAKNNVNCYRYDGTHLSSKTKNQVVQNIIDIIEQPKCISNRNDNTAHSIEATHKIETIVGNRKMCNKNRVKKAIKPRNILN